MRLRKGQKNRITEPPKAASDGSERQNCPNAYRPTKRQPTKRLFFVHYAAVEKEIGELFAPIRLEENGNVPENSDCGIGAAAKADRERKMTTDLADENGKCREYTYHCNYDWRLDPIELADDLHEFIEGVKKATGKSQVSIVCKCLGTNVR